MLDRFQAWWGRRARWQKIVLIIVAISVVFGPFISDTPADKQDEVAQSATTTNATDTPSTTAVTEKSATGATESATSTTTTVPEAPPNPGDAVSCADFDTWEEAQEWYDTYAPYYGDIALLDINNNGVACEKLLEVETEPAPHPGDAPAPQPPPDSDLAPDDLHELVLSNPDAFVGVYHEAGSIVVVLGADAAEADWASAVSEAAGTEQPVARIERCDRPANDLHSLPSVLADFFSKNRLDSGVAFGVDPKSCTVRLVGDLPPETVETLRNEHGSLISFKLGAAVERRPGRQGDLHETGQVWPRDSADIAARLVTRVAARA